MSAALNVQIDASFNIKITEQLTTGGVAANVTPSFPATQSIHLANGLSVGGTVASVCDLWYVKAGVVLASSANHTYTLSSLSSTDADDIGRTIAFARIRVALLYVSAASGDDYFTVGAAGTHPWTAPFSGTTPAAKVRTLWYVIDNSPAALVVTAASSDQLEILNSGSANMTYTLVLGGNSD